MGSVNANRSFSTVLRAARHEATLLNKLPWLSIAPLGLPVVPEV